MDFFSCFEIILLLTFLNLLHVVLSFRYFEIFLTNPYFFLCVLVVKLLSFPILESAWERGRFSSCQARSDLVLVGGAEDDRRSQWPPGNICCYGAALILFVSPSPELRHLISNWSVFFSRFYQILTNSQVRPSLSLYNTKQFENSRWNKDYQDIFHPKRFFCQ